MPSDAGILNAEIFGPVAPVVRFTAEDDAIRWANATEFGLVSYVYTQDLRRGLRVSEALEATLAATSRPGPAWLAGHWPVAGGRVPRGTPRAIAPNVPQGTRHDQRPR